VSQVKAYWAAALEKMRSVLEGDSSGVRGDGKVAARSGRKK